MKKSELIIVGTKGHSKVVADAVESSNSYDIVGFLDTFKTKKSYHSGRKILGSINEINNVIIAGSKTSFFIAIGDNWSRKTIHSLMYSIKPDINFATIIHPSANIGKNVKLGKGVFIAAGATVNVDTKIGNFSILNSNSSIDHDSKLGSFSSLGPNCSTGGHVIIKSLSAVCIGATVLQGVTIGKETVVGAGSLVMVDCGNNGVFYGTPAKKIRSRKKNDIYL